ncbi:MAG: hypothetical protein IPO88_04250 [Nannocystis sp.]|uniref:hypothetical protein n=1 Tax=Nannocystis sp. TaxID=1962667 RepID=UPI002429C2CC|nr:hypothetical protein [Nannocystis sp.]MBK9752712.1 hypothetical protein [Nannocystis sp.]
MRDTSLLRTRLHRALACLPLLAAGGLACDSGPAPEVKPATQTAAPVATPTPAATPTPPPPPLPPSPYPERTGQDPFDPDGIEEEGCPNGDWCAPAKIAEKLATQSSGQELGCPTRLMGHPQKSKADERQFKGISLNPMMQGRLRKIATAEQRAATKDETICCYHWFDYCSGRPLLADDQALRAPLRPGSAWLSGHVSEDSVAALPLAARRHLAGLWLRDAGDEHAAVAAFARATLELMAVGAPPELIFASQQASLDEIHHARSCFSLAALYADEPAEPGPLPALAPRDGGLVALARNTFLEGCLGETVAALAALRAGRSCQLAPVREVLATIADDETRHAELAWATLAFTVHHGGPAVAAALRELASSIGDRLHDASPEPELPAELTREVLAAHGRLGPAALATARSDAWHDIVVPTLELILGAAEAADTADAIETSDLS